MQAIITTGGLQYTVKQGQKLTVGRLLGDVGSEIGFDAIATIDGDKLMAKKGRVTAKILAHGKAPKVTSAVFKRRKGYHKKRGHRQLESRVEIQSIS